MSELAGADARRPRSRLSHAVARLEEKGWVRRENAPDRPARCRSRCSPTRAAAPWSPRRPGHVDAVRAAVFDRLDAEQVRQLRAISERIADLD